MSLIGEDSVRAQLDAVDYRGGPETSLHGRRSRPVAVGRHADGRRRRARQEAARLRVRPLPRPRSRHRGHGPPQWSVYLCIGYVRVDVADGC